MKPEKIKKIILNSFKVIIAVIFVISISLIQINSNNNKPQIDKIKEDEQQFTEREGYKEIYTPDGLRNIANDLTANYIIMQDIDMTGEDWTPIGDSSTGFSGTLDGNGYKIKNLNIQSTNQYVAIFGYIKDVGTVKNLTLENVTVNVTVNERGNHYVGAVGGNNEGTIENVKIIGNSIIEADIMEWGVIGGIVGYNEGTIDKCYNKANITGMNNNINCTGSVKVGGIAGSNNRRGIIDRCYNVGEITVKNNTYINSYIDIGGIVGVNSGAINRCHNAGKVIEINNSNYPSFVGGIAGHNNGGIGMIGTISNSYNTGDISVTINNENNNGGINVGGVAGLNGNRTIDRCYNIGNINVTCKSDNTVVNQGGVVGNIGGGKIESCYWSPETTGQETSAGGESKTFEEMLHQDTFVDWDFENIWKIKEGETTPYLRDLPMQEDEKVKAEHIIIRKYKTGTEIPVEGAVIGLFDENGNALLNENGEQIKLTTGKDGQVDFTNVEEGNYKYQELDEPEGYIKDDTMYGFTVNNDGTVTFDSGNGIIYNERVKAEHVIIRKYKTGTEIPVEGAVIGLFDENGNALLNENREQIKGNTNIEGKIIIKNVEVGTYKYQELEAPEGYIKDDTMYSFIVNNDGTITFDSANGIIYNSRVMSEEGVNKIRKYKTGTAKPVQGAIIGLFDENGNALQDREGNEIRKTTDEKGEIGIPALEVGRYKYQELEAPEGYIKDDTMYSFIVNNDGTITFDSANGIIYNSRVMSEEGVNKIRKYKTGTTEPVEGAVIGLFDEAGNALRDEEGNEIRKTTDEKGEIGIPALEVGRYKYQELEAPEGYIKDDTMYSFTVNNDGTITFDSANGIIYNEEAKANRVIIRKYKTGTTNPVEGAVIGLFDEKGKALLNENGEQIKGTTNVEGKITIENLKTGRYKYQELEAPEGYIKDDTMYSFTVNNDGTITFDSGNGIIYNSRVMSEEGANKIRKYKTGTTEPVEGAVIGLFDENGNALRDREGNRIRKTTDEKGEIEIPALEVGRYKYQELEAPEGYIKDDTMYSFTVNNDGTITFDSANGIIYNEKLEESKPPVTDDNKEPPKTDNTNKKPMPEERPAIIPQTGKSSIIIKLMGVTLSFTVYYGFKLYRQRKESNF